MGRITLVLGFLNAKPTLFPHDNHQDYHGGYNVAHVISLSSIQTEV